MWVSGRSLFQKTLLDSLNSSHTFGRYCFQRRISEVLIRIVNAVCMMDDVLVYRETP